MESWLQTKMMQPCYAPSSACLDFIPLLKPRTTMFILHGLQVPASPCSLVRFAASLEENTPLYLWVINRT